MLFGAIETWWGDGRPRRRPHEGIDLSLFVTDRGTILSLGEGSVVPAIYSGEVARIIDDFLGQSVFLRHGVFNEDGGELYTFYGHTELADGVCRGAEVMEGEPIASVACPPRMSITPHVHISLGWVQPSIAPDTLDWEVIGQGNSIGLIDPLEVINCTYRVLDHF
jgi:murein DD-endopeptidase MepM/ murein hydrolase activator NlpD